MALCGVSWAGNGIPFLTDLGFIFLAALCSVFLVVEMLRFPRRFGTGGMVIFGGVLIWYCHDFFYKWFSYDGHGVFPAWVIAKTAFLVSLITFSMVVGLNIRGGRWLTRVVCLVPEAKSGGFYACLLVAPAAIGLLPYFLFVNEAPHLAIYHDIIGMRGSRTAGPSLAAATTTTTGAPTPCTFWTSATLPGCSARSTPPWWHAASPVRSSGGPCACSGR